LNATLAGHTLCPQGKIGAIVSGEMDSSKALREAAKVGDVDRLRELLANCSPDDVNTGEPKHGYRPLHYGNLIAAASLYCSLLIR